MHKDPLHQKLDLDFDFVSLLYQFNLAVKSES